MNLIAYQHLRYDDFSLNERMFNPQDAILSLIEVLQVNAKQNNIEIVYNPSRKTQPLELIADDKRAMQVLHNLIRQAQILSFKDSKIEVDCWQDLSSANGMLYFSVTFSGEPIDTAKRDSMF